MILVFIELDGGSPEGLVRVLVDPGDEAGVFDGVEQADVERGLAAVTEGELERAGLDEVLFFGSPNEGVLLDFEATVLDSGEGEAKLTASQITVKVFSAIADGNVVGVDIAIDMEIDVGEVEGLVEVIDGERLVDDKVGGAGVKDDESLFWGREADVDSARPRLVLVKRGLTGGTFVLVGIVQVDDVQVVARSVVVKERHGSIHVEDAEPFCMEGGRDGASIGGEMDSSGGGEAWEDAERKRWKEGEEEEEDIEASKAKEGGRAGQKKRDKGGSRREEGR